MVERTPSLTWERGAHTCEPKMGQNCGRMGGSPGVKSPQCLNHDPQKEGVSVPGRRRVPTIRTARRRDFPPGGRASSGREPGHVSASPVLILHRGEAASPSAAGGFPATNPGPTFPRHVVFARYPFPRHARLRRLRHVAGTRGNRRVSPPARMSCNADVARSAAEREGWGCVTGRTWRGVG